MNKKILFQALLLYFIYKLHNYNVLKKNQKVIDWSLYTEQKSHPNTL